MAKSESSPTTSHESSSRREPHPSIRRRIGAVMMVGASLLPSVGIKHSAEAAARTETTAERTVDYRTETEIVTPAVPAHTETHTVSAHGSLKYQEGYHTDAEDAHSAGVQVEKFITDNPELFEAIETAQAVRIRGDASAENGVTNEAGLQQPSLDNETLAVERAALATTALTQQLLEATGVDITDKVTVEHKEHNLTDDEMNLVRAVSGNVPVTELVTRYNDDPTSVTQKQRAVLDVLLAQRRGFTVEIDFTVEVPGQPAVVVTRCVAVSQAGVKITEKRSNNPTEERVVTAIWNEGYIPEEPTVPEQPPRRIPPLQRELPNWQDTKARGSDRPKERYIGPNVHNGHWH